MKSNLLYNSLETIIRTQFRVRANSSRELTIVFKPRIADSKVYLYFLNCDSAAFEKFPRLRKVRKSLYYVCKFISTSSAAPLSCLASGHLTRRRCTLLPELSCFHYRRVFVKARALERVNLLNKSCNHVLGRDKKKKFEFICRLKAHIETSSEHL